MNDMFCPKSEFMGLISVSNQVLIFYSQFSLSWTQQPRERPHQTAIGARAVTFR